MDEFIQMREGNFNFIFILNLLIIIYKKRLDYIIISSNNSFFVLELAYQ
jgi:hypothetical protein